METKNKNHKIVRITECKNKLQFVKAIMENTNKRLLEAINIADLLGIWDRCETRGTLLLNESSITPEQWEKIAKQTEHIKWEYV